jgi:hypothetical protein
MKTRDPRVRRVLSALEKVVKARNKQIAHLKRQRDFERKHGMDCTSNFEPPLRADGTKVSPAIAKKWRAMDREWLDSKDDVNAFRELEIAFWLLCPGEDWWFQ